MGNYILAKDEIAGYSGPGWVPFNLWQLREYPHGPTPQRAQLVRQCADALIVGAGAREIWEAIAQRYVQPNAFSFELPIRCAEFRDQWNSTPKLTPSEHRKSRESLQRKAEQLAIELERLYSTLFILEHEDEDATNAPNFTQLLTEDELVDMERRIGWHHYNVALATMSAFGIQGVIDYPAFRDRVEWQTRDELFELLIVDDRKKPGVVPDLPSILRRVGSFLAEDKHRPPLEKPNTQNAERNYFVRRLLQYFISTTGDASPALIARITSLFFQQGITDNEVQQQRGRLPSGRLIKAKKVKEAPP